MGCGSGLFEWLLRTQHGIDIREGVEPAEGMAAIAPPHPYPVEFPMAAHWRTTEEKAEAPRAAGFVDLAYAQALTRHPKYSDEAVEPPVEGFDRGDYVAIRARKP